MKERPILFNAAMVRAILDGRKTQTRRVVKPQPDFVVNGLAIITTPEDEHLGRLGKMIACPYGQPGDRLWVRETWGAHFMWNGMPPAQIPNDGRTCLFYQADGAIVRGCESSQVTKWRPSIHMPRWASRITLEVLSVRVERLNEISDRGAANDCTAEGVFHCGMPVPYYEQWHGDGFNSSEKWMYVKLWESINGPGSWAENPWVWVVEFKRVDEVTK